MATTPTTHYSLPKPARGDMPWDTAINQALDIIDDALHENASTDSSIQEQLDAHEGNTTNPHGVTLSALADVDLTGLANGQILMWDEAVEDWVVMSLSVPSALDDLDDVDAGTPANGECLCWDEATGKWVPAAGAGGSTTFQGLVDTDVDGTQTEGQILAWNDATKKWEACDNSASISGIDDIADVSNPAPAGLSGGEVLAFNKATEKWVPAVMQVDATPPAFQFQAGTVEIGAGMAETITFPSEFSVRPYVTLGAIYGTQADIAPPIMTGTPTKSGITIYNPNAFGIDVDWHAVCGGTGGGSGTVVIGGGIPDVGSSSVNIP